MRLSVALLLTCICIPAWAQPEPQWVNTLGINGADGVGAADVDSNNQVLLAGYFTLTVDFDPGPQVEERTALVEDPFVAKYDEAGDLIWVNHFAGRGRATQLVVDSQDNILVAGVFRQSLVLNPTTTLQPVDSEDIFVVKLDPDGNEIWSFVLGGTGQNMPQAVAVDSGDRLILTGTLRNADLDPGAGTAVLNAGLAPDPFVACYDSAGNYQWSRLIEQISSNTVSTQDSAYGLAVTATDEVLVGGQMLASTRFGPATVIDAGTGSEAYMMSLTSGGALNWVKATRGTGLRTEHRALDVDAAGNIYAGGVFLGVDTDFDPDPATELLGTTNNNVDIFVAGYDPQGNLRWARFLQGPSQDWVYDLAINDSQEVVVGGWFQATTDFDPGPGVDERAAGSGNDIWFGRFDADTGDAIEVNTLLGSNAFAGIGSQLETVQPLAGGGLLVAGEFRHSTDFDPGPGEVIRSAIGSDGFVVRYAPPDDVFANGFESP